MKTKQTLGSHLDKLKSVEKGLIVWALNGSNLLGYQVHHGMLPFVNVKDVMVALDLYRNATLQGKRVRQQIKDKLRDAYNISESTTFVLWLNDKKVAKRFGAHPERGHNIPLAQKKRVTVGVRWSLPKRDHEPDDDVLVTPHVVLKKSTEGCWMVTCERKYYGNVSTWLADNCM